MKRIILIATIALCILTASLVAASDTVHAEVNRNLVQQHARITEDRGSTYSFYGGSWGWGFCLSHDATQGFANGSAYWRGVVNGFVGVKLGGVPAYVAFLALEGIAWYLQYVVDKGRGICVGFIWGSPAAPWAWSQ